MDRGEFQQDSVLKQLEVLKEEEKEFQNLKVSWILGCASVPSEEMGSEPPRSLLAEGLHPGVLGTPPCAHHRAEPAHASPSTAAAGLSVLGPCPQWWPVPEGCPWAGREALARWHCLVAPAACRGNTEVWCQDRGVCARGTCVPAWRGLNRLESTDGNKRTLLDCLVVEVSSKGGL